MVGYGQQESKSQSYTPNQNRWLSEALNVYGPTLGQNPNVYQGQRVADITSNQQSAFDFANQGGFVTNPQQTQSYFKSTIADPSMKNYQEIVNPAIKESFSGPGYWGSARATAQSKAAQDLADTLNSQWGQLNWDVAQANKQGALQQYELGSQEQALKQNQINASIAKFAEENQITDPRNLEILMSLLGMPYSSSGSSGYNINFSGNLA